MEHGVFQKRRFPGQRRGNGSLVLHADIVQHERQRLVQREDRDEVGQVAECHRFIQGDAQACRGERPQVDVADPRRVEETGQRPPLDFDANGVEVRLMHYAVSQASERVGQQYGAGVDPLGDSPKP